tara:strand:- start:970 stop:1398 length:429 start_codon:yes stop_codon:yes gene_type:complete
MSETKTKSQSIREYASKNPASKAKDIAAALNKSGVQVTQAHVSSVLSSNKSKTKTSKRSTVPDAVVDDVFTAIKIVNTAQEQETTVEDFVASLDLSWDSLEDITSMKQLKDLKSRKSYGSFVERYGKSNAIKLLLKVKKRME